MADAGVSIGEGVFRLCTSLTDIQLPEGLTTLGSRAFQNCVSLEGITLPESLTTLDFRTFDGCEKLGFVAIPSAMNSIADSAFHNCPNVQLIVFPGSYGEQFAMDHGLPYAYNDQCYASEQDFRYTVQQDGTVVINKYTGSEASVLIPHQLEGKDVATIGENAFDRNQNLVYVNIPPTVNLLDTGSFSGCPNL